MLVDEARRLAGCDPSITPCPDFRGDGHGG